MSGKDEIREQLKIKRARFSGEERAEADKSILSRFLGEFAGCDGFFVYNSFGSEADTRALISELAAAGKRLYLPRTEGGKMFAVPYCGKTRKGAFGIDEPEGQAFSGDIAVTVIPLLAVNSGGYRIGYGKGFYDGFLKDRNTLKVGLGYSFQIAEFEEDGWDIPLDLFLCEKGIYCYGKKR